MALSPCNSTTNLQNKELVQHGTVSFPIACYADNLLENPVPWHWHEEFEFSIITKGSPVFSLENAKIQLKEGQCLFVNSGALHATDNSEQLPAEFHSAVFHPRLIGGSMDSVFWQRLVQPLLKDSALRYVVLSPEILWQKQVIECFQNAWEAVSAESADYENFTRYQLSCALRLLNQNCPTIVQSPSEQERVDTNRIRTMLEFIEEHYSEDLTIERIAESVSISGSVCLRCFNQALGTSPIQYVKQLRLEKAAELLRSTTKTVKEIALECGFNDVSYFTKAFHSKKGCTPTKYRS